MAKKLEQFDPKVIRLSAEQKLRFRDEQVRVLGIAQQSHQLRAQADDLMRQAVAGEQGLQGIITEIAKENHADPLKYGFDLATLQFTLNKKAGQ